MGFSLFLFLMLALAALLVAVGIRVRDKAQGEEARVRWTTFLCLVASPLLVLSAVEATASAGFLAMPAIQGGLAALVLFPRPRLQPWSRDKLRVVAPYLVLVSTLLVLLIWQRSDWTIFVLLPALVLALVWWIWEWPRVPRALAFGLAFLLFLAANELMPSALLAQLPAWSQPAWDLLTPFVWPLIAVSAAARLVLAILALEKPLRPISVVWRVGLAIVLLASVVNQIWAAVPWDLMTDGLGGVVIVELAGFAAIAAAMLIAWKTPDWRRLAAIGFAAVVMFVMPAASEAGMRLDPVEITAQRADQVNQAVLHYHTQTGRYPVALAELSPWYLWHIPEPIMIRNVTWCYEGGEDYYRLGYLFHRSFGFRASVRIHASAGNVPNTPWPCDEALAQYNSSPYLHD